MGEETKIIPTIGRMVHYKMPNGDVRPATIVSVINDDMINIQVFTDGVNDAAMLKEKDGGIADMIMASRGIMWKTSVARGDGNGEWNWMPYQLGQAKKTEEAENKVAKECKDAPDKEPEPEKENDPAFDKTDDVKTDVEPEADTAAPAENDDPEEETPAEDPAV